MPERGRVLLSWENTVSMMLLSEVEDCFLSTCTPPFLINCFLQWNTAVPHIMKGLNIFSCYSTIPDLKSL